MPHGRVQEKFVVKEWGRTISGKRQGRNVSRKIKKEMAPKE